MRLTSSTSILVLQASFAAAQTVLHYPNCVNGTLAANKVCDVNVSPPDRAAALVAAMTIEEKLENLVNQSNGTARLGLPFYEWWSEALYGLAAGPFTIFNDEPPFDVATSFPMPVLMASSFDDELIETIGNTIGTEARAWGNAGYSGIDFWTPNVNPFKDPRWGRGSETPGEDVLRVKRYAERILRGLEGPKEERRIIATCKHFVGNDFEDWNGTTRHDFDAQISLQDLAEYYAAPFQTCARDMNSGSFMCAYNAVNGIPSCASSYLLQTVLREHWGWTKDNNYITSDCSAVRDVYEGHDYTETNAEGTAACFTAGTDTSCETNESDFAGAWDQGLLTEEVIDQALRRLYEGLVRAGYFDGQHSAWSSLGWGDVNTPEAQALALQTAVESIVMLKNDGTLPLELESGDKVALIGFWADDGSKLQGGYRGIAPYLHSPAWAARELGLDVSVTGGPILQEAGDNDNWTAPALAAASAADYILYFGGFDTSLASEGRDRTDLTWPSAQTALLEKLGDLGKPLVIVQLGDQLDDTEFLDADWVSGIFWASWPGQDGGLAIMQLITGAENPAGRLSITMYPKNYTDLVPMTDMSLRPSDESPGRTYRWYETPVLPFGYGLHYTTFEATFTPSSEPLNIQDLLSGCDLEHPDMCPLPPLLADVTNTGDRTSDYVVLAFVKAEAGPEPYPIKTLSAYKRLHGVEPGATTQIELDWKLANLARFDEDGNTVLYPGTYTVLLDEPSQSTVELTLSGDAAILDEWPSP